MIVDAIAGTKTRSGLTVLAEFDTGSYPKGVVVTDVELAAVRLEPGEFHGDWNYRIRTG